MKNIKPKHWIYLTIALLFLLNLISNFLFEPRPFLGFLLFVTVLIGIHLTLKDWRIKKESKMLKFIHYLYYIGVVLGLVISLFLFILIQSPQGDCKVIDSEKIEGVNTMIILGAGLKNDEPEQHLIERLDLALEVVKMSGAKPMQIIVTGGIGRGETLSEAQAMGAYLVEKGVPEEWIIYENEATSTFENFEFSRKKIQELASEIPESRLNRDKEMEILLITSNFHIYRSTMLAKHFGFDPIPLCSPMQLHKQIGATLREIAALAKDGVKVWARN